MNTVVNRLLDVDKQARVILDDAKQYYDRTLEEIAAEKKKITDKYEAKAGGHLEDIKNAERESSAEADSGIKERYGKLTAEMDAAFEQNRGRWEDELFNKCVGR